MPTPFRSGAVRNKRHECGEHRSANHSDCIRGFSGSSGQLEPCIFNWKQFDGMDFSNQPGKHRSHDAMHRARILTTLVRKRRPSEAGYRRHHVRCSAVVGESVGLKTAVLSAPALITVGRLRHTESPGTVPGARRPLSRSSPARTAPGNRRPMHRISPASCQLTFGAAIPARRQGALK